MLSNSAWLQSNSDVSKKSSGSRWKCKSQSSNAKLLQSSSASKLLPLKNSARLQLLELLQSCSASSNANSRNDSGSCLRSSKQRWPSDSGVWSSSSNNSSAWSSSVWSSSASKRNSSACCSCAWSSRKPPPRQHRRRRHSNRQKLQQLTSISLVTCGTTEHLQVRCRGRSMWRRCVPGTCMATSRGTYL